MTALWGMYGSWAAVSATASTAAPAAPLAPAVAVRGLRARYHSRAAVNDVSLDFRGGAVTAIIGPSGCGKSTLLRCINRLHETVAGATVGGQVLLDGRDVYAASVNPVELRRRVGMVFQRATPFPALSVFDNVAAGLRAGPERHGRAGTADAVEQALRRASLWNEVRDRLHGSALALSGGQQQRLCIARALAVDPAVLLLDEPTTSLDPVGTQRIEELLYELRGSVTVVVVTHNMQQAARISDVTTFMLDGGIVEHGETRALFTTPSDPRTEAYITGRFG